jgi:hypothetical protein
MAAKILVKAGPLGSRNFPSGFLKSERRDVKKARPLRGAPWPEKRPSGY